MTATSPNSWLKESNNTELVALHYYMKSVGTTRALIEFAARVCYRSTGKLGTSINFVDKVLSDGHLSVAEHPSFFLKYPLWESDNKFRIPFLKESELIKIPEKNRYVTATQKAVFGNLRALREGFQNSTTRAAQVLNSTLHNYFPTFFEISNFEPLKDITLDSVYVPGNDNVVLLAFNLGTTTKVHYFNKLKPDKYGRLKNWSRYTFLISCSRNCSQQLSRHRGASISQESQRYVDSRNNPLILPPSISEKNRQLMESSYMASIELYEKLREDGVKKEDARSILPGGIQTRMVVSFDYYELLHFLKLRTEKHAQWEIREIARKMLKQSLLVTCEEKGAKLHELASSITE